MNILKVFVNELFLKSLYEKKNNILTVFFNFS